ncbi:MAG: hypothetical protein Hyperionvirus14_46 [Hyperionvirus sp.]|uniref:Uncharacterized protein n=1 Tax=Hyperionvirus sp. TaxID=2487770 RepID=A0A3G5A9L5_9VIRU|nr:MAG: hypothetical protein Hyperionvirus14_46 [Hyperionvirus sp.]
MAPTEIMGSAVGVAIKVDIKFCGERGLNLGGGADFGASFTEGFCEVFESFDVGGDEYVGDAEGE